MKLTGLSLDQAPPISVPFRFFLTAPLMGMVTALLMIQAGPELAGSRWHPGFLAVSHGILLGFLAPVMFGALQQMLPVLAGVNIPWARLLAWSVHLLWIIGALLLQAAFVLGEPWLFNSAMLMLSAAAGCFVLACGAALLRSDVRTASAWGMLLAIAALTITLALGIKLGLGHSGILMLDRPHGTNLHMLWGILGWTALLIISIAWQVVPMFQITPSYHHLLVRWLAPVVFIALLLRPLIAPDIVAIVISLALLVFATNTLWLQHKRLRKITDLHLFYWRIACISLIAAVFCWWIARLGGVSILAADLYLLCAVLFVMGFVLAIVTGMLYKIVAFLVWFHLQGISSQQMMAGKPAINVPHMKAIISASSERWQLGVFSCALLIQLLSVIWPHWFAVPAGVAWFLFFTVMAVNLFAAVRTYNRCLRQPGT